MSSSLIKQARVLLDKADDACEMCCGNDPPWGDIRSVFDILNEILTENGMPRLTPRVGSKEWIDAHK